MNIKELQDEIKEISHHLADMLEAALYFAGVKEDQLEKAATLYIESMDEALKDTQSDEMDRDDIIKVINYLKEKHPELFKS